MFASSRPKKKNNTFFFCVIISGKLSLIFLLG